MTLHSPLRNREVLLSYTTLNMGERSCGTGCSYRIAVMVRGNRIRESFKTLALAETRGKAVGSGLAMQYILIARPPRAASRSSLPYYSAPRNARQWLSAYSAPNGTPAAPWPSGGPCSCEHSAPTASQHPCAVPAVPPAGPCRVPQALAHPLHKGLVANPVPEIDASLSNCMCEQVFYSCSHFMP